MALLQRVRWSDVHWLPICIALVMTCFGVAFVISACLQADAGNSWGVEAKKQCAWWGIATIAMLVCLHVPLKTWQQMALPAYIGSLLMQVFMFIMAGSALVPAVKGQHNWLVVGPLRLQPSEFYKLAVLLFCAQLLCNRSIDARKWSSSLLVLIIGGLPALLLAKEDLGSALTMIPMVLGMLIFAGMPLRLLGLLLATIGSIIVAGIQFLPKDGYQYLRIQAWLNPENFQLTYGYQTLHSTRAIGSGQLFGKGYGAGDQNLLGWLPEKHTDMIFAVIGEEWGFLGCILALGLFFSFGCAGMWSAIRCRNDYGQLLIAGFTCLVLGQMTINLFVVLGLMPVTGITLPFFSYGGSSLLSMYIGLGILAAASVSRKTSLFSSMT